MKEKRWLINNCIDCNTLISFHAKRCKPCRGKHSSKSLGNCIVCNKDLITYGSKMHQECYLNQKRNDKNFCIDCNIKINYKSTRCLSCFNKFQIGNNHPNFGNRYSKSICSECGKRIDYYAGKCWSCHWEQFPKPKCIDCGKEISYGSNRCQYHANIKGLKISYKRYNKCEQLVDNILISLLGNKYKFVGDGKVKFDRFNPDFININGQKKIIEFYGDYWHNKEKSKEADFRRLKIYKKYGYKTLVIWGSELKNNIDYVVSKILAFEEEK